MIGWEALTEGKPSSYAHFLQKSIRGSPWPFLLALSTGVAHAHISNEGGYLGFSGVDCFGL